MHPPRLWRFFLNKLFRSQPTKRRLTKLRIEQLEDRVVPATITWNNVVGSGDWDVGSNWIGGATPGTGDNAVIDTTSAATITIQSGDAIQVQSVTTSSDDTLEIDSGVLIVTASNSILSGPLSMNGGELEASGSGVTFAANGATSVPGASLDAEDGASMSFPQLTTYAANTSTFTADGTGSVLNLSSLATVNQQQGYWSVNVTNGGELDLSSLTSVSGVYDSQITDTGNSTILDPNLTSLDSTSVTLDGTDPNVANSWTSFTNGTLNVTGGTYSLPGLKDLDGSNLLISTSGSLTLPGLTNFTSNSSTFSVDGLGSVLNISALSTVNQQGYWSLNATNGGELDLSSLTSLSGDYDSQITDTGGSTILDPNLTSIDSTTVTLDGTGPNVANSWTSFTNGTLNVTGGSYDLTNYQTSKGQLSHLEAARLGSLG
jgi:hypothetical protein